MDDADIIDVFERVARVQVRRMFGGHGVYLEGLMFALEADGVLYMRCDSETMPLFEARGLAPFTYMKNGKPYALGYRALPDSAFDDDDELRLWTKLALEAARRKAAAKPAKHRATSSSRAARKPAARSTR